MNELETLRQYAQEYVADKAEESVLKKRLEKNNANIKALMELLGLPDVELGDGSKVHYSVTKKTSLDEEKLIEYLHKFAPDTQCIKTKEYIDMDILESEIYHEQLPTEMVSAMEKCTHVKEVPTITIKKGKKGD